MKRKIAIIMIALCSVLIVGSMAYSALYGVRSTLLALAAEVLAIIILKAVSFLFDEE